MLMLVAVGGGSATHPYLTIVHVGVDGGGGGATHQGICSDSMAASTVVILHLVESTFYY